MKEVFSHQLEGARLIGTYSEDRVKLFLEIKYEPDFTISAKDLFKILSEYVPEDRLDEGVLNDITHYIYENKPVQGRRIAKGREPGPGVDGKLVMLVKVFTGKVDLQSEDEGTRDLRELHLFDSVEAGQTIARLYPPRKGEDGETALGEVIESQPGKVFSPKLHKSLTLKSPESGESYQRIVSTMDGYVSSEAGQLKMNDVLTIDGDVDYRIGNLNFIGTIAVSGDVTQGFTLQAGIDIEIRGTVQGATLIAPAGSIRIKGNASGSDTSYFAAGQNIEMTIAANVHAEAGHQITIAREALDCTLRAGSFVSAPEAKIIGGEIYAVCGLEGKSIGNKAGVTTRILLCNSVEISREFGVIGDSIRSHEKVIELLTLQLGPFAKDQSRLPLLRPDFKRKIEGMLRKREKVAGSLEVLVDKRTALLRTAQSGTSAQVNALAELHAGVVIRSREKCFEVKESLAGPCTVFYDSNKGEFRKIELQPMICVLEDVDDKGSDQ